MLVLIFSCANQSMSCNAFLRSCSGTVDHFPALGSNTFPGARIRLRLRVFFVCHQLHITIYSVCCSLATVTFFPRLHVRHRPCLAGQVVFSLSWTHAVQVSPSIGTPDWLCLNHTLQRDSLKFAQHRSNIGCWRFPALDNGCLFSRAFGILYVACFPALFSWFSFEI